MAVTACNLSAGLGFGLKLIELKLLESSYLLRKMEDDF
jgi:hypothetical protein